MAHQHPIVEMYGNPGVPEGRNHVGKLHAE
jgi:hypothetical protein